MNGHLWETQHGESPVLGTAIHDGHDLRPEVAALMRLGDADRLREEDPFTGSIAAVVPTCIVPLRSRFEVDLNRPRDRAVYLRPEDAWGLDVWHQELPTGVVDESLRIYDAFYAELRAVLDRLVADYGRFVVLDVHSYNHRRGGPAAPPDDPEANPEVNIGTGSMDRARWAGLVDRFIADLRRVETDGRALDVRENVRFRGGNMARWIHSTYPETGCALAIEFKKIFMDEWTGVPDVNLLSTLHGALGSTLPGLEAELTRTRA